ncbi:hypothetical protein [Prosthecobacter sp.]|uniref:hypothetical protein n=1 Tax=Prosthecobacter sp. TaxID=1965333 RepID=UPI001D3B0886|nr:hypothetical protein [Prosthecobacter sp.]MCB1277594.1 hypothetical protein [Prosthecobacter sp.]
MVVLVITVSVIWFAPKSWLAQARAEISPLDVAPTGMAGFVRVDFAYGNRMLPQEMVARMTSSGTLRRALQKLGWPDDEAGMDKAADSVMAHLVPGSTVIEVLARSDKRDDALALVAAVLEVQDDIRREMRGDLAQQLLGVLDKAAADLGRERHELAEKLVKMDVHLPVDYSAFVIKMESTLADITEQRMRLAGILRRIETLTGEGRETARGSVEEELFATNAGYANLRARLGAKQAQMARVTTTQGTSSKDYEQTASEVRALEDELRQFVSGAAAQYRSQMQALDQSAEEIERRMKTREEALSAARATLLSPEYESLQLRAEMIREQLKQIALRRAEIQTYQQLHQTALRVVVPPEVGAAPEDRFRGARVVFAVFGALFIGLSLTTILHHRSAPPPGEAFI